MKRRRVVVTGLGVVAPNGFGKEAFATAIFSGLSGIRSCASDESPCPVEARVPEFDLPSFLGRRVSGHFLSRVSSFAVATAKMALDDAGIDIEKLDPLRTGLCYGTTTGKPDFEDDAARFVEFGVAGLGPTAWAEFSPHAPASHIASELGFFGPIGTHSAGCCTGLTVVDWGADRIATGQLNMALVGSGDSLLSPLTVAAFCAGKLLTSHTDPTKAARPFDLHRDGLVPGEAAGAVVLEPFEAAVARGARIYAEYFGYGSAVDSTRAGARNHNDEGLARAIDVAIHRAGLSQDQIDCINSHGLSHPVFDRLETQGFKLALGRAAYNVPVTSIKSMTGACFAGDGILQVISSCLSLNEGMIPPILNYETPDPVCDLDYVVDSPRRARINRILTNTRALGGANSVLILGRIDRGR